MYCGKKPTTVQCYSHISLLSLKPHLMPDNTDIDSRVTLGPVVPQLSSYTCFSLLFLLSLGPLVNPAAPLVHDGM